MASTTDTIWKVVKRGIEEHHEHCCGRINAMQEDLQKTNETLAHLLGKLEVYRELGSLKPGQKLLIGGTAVSGWVAVGGLIVQKALGLG